MSFVVKWNEATCKILLKYSCLVIYEWQIMFLFNSKQCLKIDGNVFCPLSRIKYIQFNTALMREDERAKIHPMKLLYFGVSSCIL